MERAYDHSNFREQLDAYLAGGLGGAEREAFEAHAAACAACAALLSDAAAQDASLRELFADARPPADLEDRLVDRLRGARPLGPMLHPMVRRAAAGVAAALVLGGFGYVANQSINNGGLPTPWANDVRPQAAVGPRQAGRQVVQFSDQSAVTTPESVAVVDFQSPAEMADSFNKLTKQRGGGESWYSNKAGVAVSGAAVRGRTSASGVDEDRRAAALGVPGGMPGMMAARPEPANSSTPESAKEAKRSLDDAKKLGDTNGVAADTRAKDATLGDVSLGYRYATGGGRAAGGAGMGGGYGMNGPAAGAPVGGGGGAPAADKLSDHGALYGRFYAENGRGWAAPANREHFGLNVQPEADAKQRVTVLADDGVAKAQESAAPAKADAFKPNDFFATGVPAPATASPTGNAPADNAKPEDVRDAQVGQSGEEGRHGEPKVAGKQVASGAAPATPQSQPQTPAAADPTAGRKIIRNGEMSFEVDSFDSAYLQIVKIAAEEGGFVATTDSEKLANGKVKGTVTVRVPPDRLDTLVLKLRGLGDLKSSRLAANDITKQYTDLESQLRASRAMEERLLNIIKTGKGEIKDLVEAEKQLGVYREKIEQVEGEIRYYNNLVSLSTLNVTLIERDIRTAAMLSETEQVNMGVESQDVEKARAAAIKAIEEAKGRIVESDLKKLEAGQFAGRIVADVPPDAAGPLIDRMKQIGTVARLEVSRKQAAPEGTVAPTPAQGGAGVRVERRDTRFLISLYNLANVAPRQTTNLNLAAEDVEAAYRAILEQVKSAGGRVVTSQLNRPRPDQTTGTITFEAPAEGADVLLGAVRAAGEVMRLEVTQNPDAQNVTEAKRGFAVQVFSIASVAPRETTMLRVAARGVSDAFNRLRESVRTAQGARVLSSQLKEDDPANVAGTLDFEVRRQDWAAVETALRDAGQVVSRNVIRSADTENTVDTKVRVQVVLVDEAALQPRESVAVQLAVADVSGRYAKLLEALGAAQARILQSQLTEQEAQHNVTGTLVFDVRRENRAAVDRAMSDAGDIVSRSVVRSTDTQNTLDDKVRLSLTLVDALRLPPRETTTLGMEAADVEKGKEQIESLALSLGGRVVDSTLSREPSGRAMAKVVADVPLGRAMEMVRRTRDQGRVIFRREARDETVPQGSLARARVDVTLDSEGQIVESGQGLGSRIREGLRTSVTGLLWSVQLIVIGLLLVAPWALIVYFGWRLVRRGRTRKAAPTGAPVPA